MRKFAPLTKLLMTIIVPLWAIMSDSLLVLGGLLAVQFLLLAVSGVPGKTYKAVGGLFVVAAVLVGIQYALERDAALAVSIGLRMVAMTTVFIMLLATTRIQDLTAALVSQCRIPYEYAFIFTAALRFIPDFIEESKAVQEAQACRGYAPKGNIFRRLTAFVAIIEPLVLKAVTRSETMALSLELRGFGSVARKGFAANIALAGRDYAAFTAMALATVGIVYLRVI